MATHAFSPIPAPGGLARWVLTGALAGAISVLLFQQGIAAVLHAWGLLPQAPYAFEPTRPFGVPVLWSLAFWGGAWGAVLAASLARLQGAALVAAATAFGAVLPTAVALIVVAPLKGQPPVTGIVPLAILLGGLLNGAWGFGTGLGLALLGREHRGPR